MQNGKSFGNMLTGKYLPVGFCLAVQHLLEQLQLKTVVVEDQNLMVGKGLLVC